MVKRQIGVEVLVTDYFWNEASGKYVYSFQCPACNGLKLTPRAWNLPLRLRLVADKLRMRTED